MRDAMDKNRMGAVNYPGVDLAKFICALMVVAIHISPFGARDSGARALLNFGVQQWLTKIAVPFFFVASGFFLYRKSGYDDFSADATKRYVLKLLKLYAIWSILYLPLRMKDILFSESGIAHEVLRYLQYVIFVGSYTQLWYLTAAAFAVILVSFLISRRVAIKKILLIAALLYGMGLLAQSWFGVIVPLRTWTPSLWALLKRIQEVMLTTRNGLFEGFLFVGMGATIAYRGFRMSGRTAWIGFIVSYVLMLMEVVFVTHFRLSRETSMYIFLVPLTYFAFGLAMNLPLRDRKIYGTLRVLSTLIFLIHLWVRWLIQKAFWMFGFNVARTGLLYILTVLFSILCSLLIVKLSEVKHFRWLKRLYS